jgi:hypothetical protein
VLDSLTIESSVDLAQLATAIEALLDAERTTAACAGHGRRRDLVGALED